MLQLDANGLSTEDAYTKDFDSITGQQVLTDHGAGRHRATRCMVVANADQADAVAAGA